MKKSLKNQILLKPITLVDVGFKGGVQEKVAGFERKPEHYRF